MKPLPGRTHQRYIQTKIRVGGRRKTVYLHRRVWEEANGPVPEGFAVHHIDHNRENNALSNLELVSIREHNAAHGADGRRILAAMYAKGFRISNWGKTRTDTRGRFASTEVGSHRGPEAVGGEGSPSTAPVSRLVSEREPDVNDLVRERDPFFGVLSSIAVGQLEETLAAFRIRKAIWDLNRR